MATQNDADGLGLFKDYVETMDEIISKRGADYRKGYFIGIAYGLNLTNHISDDCLDDCLDYIRKGVM